MQSAMEETNSYNAMDQNNQELHDQPSSPVSMASPTSTSSEHAGNESPDFVYDALFPALPGNKAAPNAPQCVRVVSTQQTQVLHVPFEERKSTDSEKFGEGESKRICQQITKETGALIEIASGRNHSLTFLIKGKKSELSEARRKILKHFTTQDSVHVSIPKEHHRLILGKRAQRLKDLEMATDTRITVPQQSDESDVIIITGPKDGIEKAQREIRQLSMEQSKKSIERTSVPKIYHPFILGPHNKTLNQIQEETGAQINMPPQSVPSEEIVIKGEKEAVAEAKLRIEEIYKKMEKTCSTVSVEVAKSQHRFVIGPKYSTIAEILELTGVSVEMPPSDSPIETITLRGPQAALGSALTVVCEKANSVKSVAIAAPKWTLKYIIGRKGAVLKDLEEKHPGVKINCVENVIRVEGNPENVDKVSVYLNDVILGYQKNYACEALSVNHAFHKHIIGKNGANINRLKDELKVNIHIEERDGENIHIDGPIEGVKQAMRELKEQVDKLENEKSKDVIIDRRLHRSIIGSKGEKIREIKDRYRNVTIAIPTPQDNTDIVKLRGPKEEVDKCHKDLMKMVKEIQESSHMVKVPIFKQYLKLVIAKGGANIKKIREETQTKIELPSENDKNESIIITGKKENTLEAQKRIQKIIDELSDVVTEEVQIPSKYYKSIIGSGGKLISSIMEECGGVSIEFPNSDSKSDKVVICGPKEDVQKAKVQLLELSNEMQAASFTAEVRAKQQHHKFLIGKKGASIRKIRDSTGARIIFPSNDDVDKEVITIIGKEESVKIAKQQLEAFINDIEQVTESEITVDPKYHKHFVQRRGEVLHRIIEDCGGVMISFPKAGVDSDKVTIKGSKDCIEAAKQRIMEIVNDLDAQVTIQIVIPQRLHRTVMGARGSKIQQVTSDFDVNIKFPDRDATDVVPEEVLNGSVIGVDNLDEPVRQCDVIRISGRSDKCEAAKQALIDLIPITKEISVPFELHRSIIGPKGCNVREFMSKYDVHIDVPRSENKSDIIKLSGTPACVAEAQIALDKMMEEYEADRADRELRSYSLQIEVEPEYHSKLIGRKGAVINKLRADHDVNISLPKRDDENQRTITIVGYQANAEAARDAIMEIVGELQDLHREVIEIDSRVHSHIIGSRGRTIRKIIEDYKVDIKLPTAEEAKINPDAITIIGKEEYVENAKEYLLSMAEDYTRDFLDTLPPSPQPQTMAAFLSNRNGFVVKDAPWDKTASSNNEQNNHNNHHNDRNNIDATAPNTQSKEDFPMFAAAGNGKASNVSSAPITSAWGPKH